MAVDKEVERVIAAAVQKIKAQQVQIQELLIELAEHRDQKVRMMSLLAPMLQTNQGVPVVEPSDYPAPGAMPLE